MLSDRDDIDKQLLLTSIEAAYGLGLHTIAFVPKGQEAYTYLAQADDEMYFVRLQPADKARDLELVYMAVHALNRGLGEVLAPMLNRAGRSTIEYGDELVAVFPFVQGETLWQRGASASDIEAAIAIVARLHNSRISALLPREEFDNPFEQQIRRALAHVADREWRPLQREACRLLAAERGDILGSLQRFERLGQQLRRRMHERVPTHGDPNRDNFLRDRSGALHLTDWGELAAGPPERDLWHFSDDMFDTALRRYLSLRPLESLDIDALAFYAYRWIMQEIADYSTRLLFNDLGPAEDEHAWNELQNYLPIRHGAVADGLEQMWQVIRGVMNAER